MQSISIGTFTIMQGDTNKAVVVNVNNVNGTAVDLSTATDLKFTMDGPAFVSGNAESGVPGVILYNFTGTNTAVVGTYRGAFTFKISGKPQTIPDGRDNRPEFITIYVVPRVVSPPAGFVGGA